MVPSPLLVSWSREAGPDLPWRFGTENRLSGIVAAHVDDLLYTGCEEAMDSIAKLSVRPSFHLYFLW